MLFVETEVRPSTLPGAGLGLFAAQDIPAGTLCFRWTRSWDFEMPTTGPLDGRGVSVNDLPAIARRTLEHYGWREDETTWRMSLDNSRFTNHSLVRQNIDWRRDGMHALRDIKAGEELFESYASFDPDFGEYAATLTDFCPHDSVIDGYGCTDCKDEGVIAPASAEQTATKRGPVRGYTDGRAWGQLDHTAPASASHPRAECRAFPHCDEHKPASAERHAPPRRFRHYKGSVYELMETEVHREATDDIQVVYRSVENGAKWCRPAEEFFGESSPGVRRFTPIEPDASAERAVTEPNVVERTVSAYLADDAAVQRAKDAARRGLEKAAKERPAPAPAKCAHAPCVAKAHRNCFVCLPCRGWSFQHSAMHPDNCDRCMRAVADAAKCGDCARCRGFGCLAPGHAYDHDGADTDTCEECPDCLGSGWCPPPWERAPGSPRRADARTEPLPAPAAAQLCEHGYAPDDCGTCAEPDDPAAESPTHTGEMLPAIPQRAARTGRVSITKRTSPDDDDESVTFPPLESRRIPSFTPEQQQARDDATWNEGRDAAAKLMDDLAAALRVNVASSIVPDDVRANVERAASEATEHADAIRAMRRGPKLKKLIGGKIAFGTLIRKTFWKRPETFILSIDTSPPGASIFYLTRLSDGQRFPFDMRERYFIAANQERP